MRTRTAVNPLRYAFPASRKPSVAIHAHPFGACASPLGACGQNVRVLYDPLNAFWPTLACTLRWLFCSIASDRSHEPRSREMGGKQNSTANNCRSRGTGRVAERFVIPRPMKASVIGIAVVVLILNQHATNAAEPPPKKAMTSPGVISGPPLAEIPNFPVGYDIIQGNPPDSHIKRWIRYVIVGQHNHPFPIGFFSPQEFGPKTALESLIVLTDSEFKSLSAFSHTQSCTKQPLRPKNDQWLAGQITEYDRKETKSCALFPIDACNYLLGLMELPDIKWTPAQLQLIRRMATETNCKTKKLDSAP